jgi:hypothetical protein
MTESGRQYQEVTMTLFYAKSKWHILIKDFLIPLLKEINLLDKQTYHVVHFNEERGQNICVTWFISTSYGDLILEKIHHEGKLFLKNNPSRYNCPIFNTHSTFKNFPLNSVHYNLYKFPYIKIKHLDLYDFIRISSSLTAIISRVLVNDPIDTDVTFTLAFYLHVLLIKTFSLELDAKLTSIDDSPDNNRSIVSDNEMQNIFVNNRAIFDDIIIDLNNDNFLNEKDNNWLLLWSQTCYEICNKNRTGLLATNSNALLNEMSKLILQQLGLNISVQKLIVTFINQSINTN